MKNIITFLMLVCSLTVNAQTQTEHLNKFIGDWKIDLESSSSDIPEYIFPDIKFKIEPILDGKTIMWTIARNEGDGQYHDVWLELFGYDKSSEKIHFLTVMPEYESVSPGDGIFNEEGIFEYKHYDPSGKVSSHGTITVKGKTMTQEFTTMSPRKGSVSVTYLKQ